MAKFKHRLKENLKEIIPEDLIPLLPSGFQQIGSVVILNLKEKLIPHKKIIAQHVLELIPSAKSIWIRTGKISGQFREPEGLEHVLGPDNTEVEHHENQIRYFFDFTKIMYSKGNFSEKKYLPELVRPGEIIVDMFAGIGYFSLSLGKFSKAKRIYSIELNPISFKYLKKNIEKNHLKSKIIPIHGDTKVKTPELAKKGIKADRIVMGVFPAPYDYIPAALSVVKRIPLNVITHIDLFIKKSQETYKFNIYDELEKYIKYNGDLPLNSAESSLNENQNQINDKISDKINDKFNDKINDKIVNNTVVHFEGVTMGRDITALYSKFEKLIKESGLRCSLLAFRFVKSFGPKMWHLVLDIGVGC